MIVYLVIDIDYEDRTILGIFSSREKAETARRERGADAIIDARPLWTPERSEAIRWKYSSLYAWEVDGAEINDETLV